MDWSGLAFTHCLGRYQYGDSRANNIAAYFTEEAWMFAKRF